MIMQLIFIIHTLIEITAQSSSTKTKKKMDNILTEDEFSIAQVALYASISFIVVSLLGVFIYITCSRKYKLNWFEKNLLETASEHQELNER